MSRSRLGVPVLIVSTAVSGGVTLAAIYAPVEARRVPVGRLVENLERRLAQNPGNAQHHVNLGRLHGMAFALKTDEAPAIVSKDGIEEPWYGHEPKLIPYQTRPPGSEAAKAVARKHLQAALHHYEAALELDPDNLLAQLGFGWMLQQSGDRTRAVTQYRRLIAQAWAVEKDQSRHGIGQLRLFSYEAIDYLVPLLDPRADAAEISDLRSRQALLDKRPRAITPIAVPLADGVPPAAIHDRLARIRFDADGSGIRREWSWIGSHAGWLVFDRDGAGEITSGLQLFGNVTFWLFWKNGYDALAALDDDQDGVIAGAEMEHLAIWRDANRNGISEPGEVAPLAAHGIESLSCEYEDGDGLSFAAVSPAGVRLVNGRTRPTYDVLLRAHGSPLTMTVAPGGSRPVFQNRAAEHD